MEEEEGSPDDGIDDEDVADNGLRGRRENLILDNIDFVGVPISGKVDINPSGSFAEVVVAGVAVVSLAASLIVSLVATVAAIAAVTPVPFVAGAPLAVEEVLLLASEPELVIFLILAGGVSPLSRFPDGPVRWD